MLIKCNCNNCPAHLEFDSSNAGTVVVCPKCGLETTLFIPAVKKPAPPQGLPVPSLELPPPASPPSAQPLPPAPKPVQSGRPPTGWELILLYWGARIGSGILILAGMLLIFAGCSGVLKESAGESGSALRQTLYTIQYGTGFILIGLGAILELLHAIVRK